MTDTRKESSAHCRSLWIVVALFAATVLYINPLRETAIEDDWSYSLMVRDLLETGTYRLHEWAAASMPFQTYWGALFAKTFGYSFASLRISTIVMAIFGLIAFYQIAREHELNCIQAVLLTLGLLACPLFLLFTFSFMTDVPFLAWSLISIFLYTKAVRLRHFFLMFTASLAASAAIFIRQFGLAFPAAIFAVWVLQKDRKSQISFFVIGFLLPTLAALLQLAWGLFTPNWTAELRLHQQSEYFSTNGILLPVHMLWRGTVILHYIALFSLPFLLGVAYTAFKSDARNLWLRRSLPFIAVMIIGLLYGHFVEGVSWSMPYLPWYLFTLSKGTIRPVVLTLTTGIGGVLIGWIFAQRYKTNPGWSNIPAHQQILDLLALTFLLLQLFYVQFYDRYLLVFLPPALIIIGRYSSQWLNRQRVLTMLMCLLVLSASAMWSRGWISHEEAMWKGSEVLRRQNIEPTQIFGSWIWNCYFTFEDYLADIGHQKQSGLDDFFFRWLPEKRRTARYVVTDMAHPGTGWRRITTVSYRNSFFRRKSIIVMERIPVN